MSGLNQIRPFNPVASFQGARRNALGIQQAEQAIDAENQAAPYRNELNQLRVQGAQQNNALTGVRTQAAQQGMAQGAENHQQSQMLMRAKMMGNVSKALLGLPPEQRGRAWDTLGGELKAFGIDTSQIPADQFLTDENLQASVLKTQAIEADPVGSFSRPLEGVIDGKRVYFQTDKDGTFKQVEGVTPPQSDAEITRATKAEEAERKRQDRINNAREQASIIVGDIRRSVLLADKAFTTGLPGAIMQAVPGTDAYDLKQMLVGIKANVGFNKLQQMREASKTGGALGAVSERENQLLQSVYGSLEQSQNQEQFRYNMNRLDTIFSAVVNGIDGRPAFVWKQEDFDKLSPGDRYINGKTGEMLEK